MSGELGAVWPYTWSEIWLPLIEHVEFGDTLVLDLFRNHVPEPKHLKPVSELSADELARFTEAVRRHEEAATDASLAKESLHQGLINGPISEATAIAFLESSYSLFEEYDDGNFANEYFNRVDRFLRRYSLRYDLRRPLTLHPTLPGIFSSLVKELHTLSLKDSHIDGLLKEFEDSIRDLKTGISQARIKTCLQKQFNLLEALGRSFPGVTCQTLGDISGEINTWPHATIREALKRLYGFRSDYPGVGHAGNPASVLRELDIRDMVAIGVMLTGFVPYLSNRIDPKLVYNG